MFHLIYFSPIMTLKSNWIISKCCNPKGFKIKLVNIKCDMLNCEYHVLSGWLVCFLTWLEGASLSAYSYTRVSSCKVKRLTPGRWHACKLVLGYPITFQIAQKLIHTVCQKQIHVWNYKTNITGSESFQHSFMKLNPRKNNSKTWTLTSQEWKSLINIICHTWN